MHRIRRRTIFLALAGLIVLTVLPATPASATLVNLESECELRGPVQGVFTNVCVRLQTETSNGTIRAYGALDGPSSSTRVFIRALQLRLCDPQPGGTFLCSIQRTADAKGAWDDVSQWTNWYSPPCAYYYAVMSYDIRWPNGQLTRRSNFATNAIPISC